MATYTITIDEKTQKGKSILTILKSMNDVVSLLPETNKSPYNQEFVKKIQKSRRSEGKAIKTEDLWK